MTEQIVRIRETEDGTEIGAPSAYDDQRIVWLLATRFRRLHDEKDGTTRITLDMGETHDPRYVDELVRATPPELVQAISTLAANPGTTLLITSRWDIHLWAKEGERLANEDVQLRFEGPQHKYVLEYRARFHAQQYAKRQYRDAFNTNQSSDWRVSTGIDLLVAAYLAHMAHLNLIRK